MIFKYQSYMVQKTENTRTKPNRLGLHPLVDENTEASKDPVRKAIALLLTRKNQDEIIFLRSPEGLKLMYLRYEVDAKTNPKICLMFKRSPELKPYYKAIKSWCEDNGFQWKGKIFNGNRYMETSLSPYIDEITKTILTARQSIFKVTSLSVGTNSTSLSFAIDDFHHPYLWAFFGLASAVSLGLLPLYEIFRLPYLGKPSINAMDWPELFLIILIFIGVFTVRYINRKKDDKPPKNILKIYLARAALLVIISLTFFTY